MNSTPEADIAALQARIVAATRDKIRAEHARDTAAATRDSARAELRKEFGVTTVTDAERVLAELRADLTRIVAEINTTLDGLTG